MIVSSLPKIEAYEAHVLACRTCARCQGTINLSASVHPSPWASLMGSLDAHVVVVGQDFACIDNPRTEPDPSLPTNRNLRQLIRAADLEERDIYLTNAMLCLKPGSMSAPVRSEWVRNCSSLLRRTIQIVSPKAVAALGAVAWRSLGHVFAIPLPPLADSVGREPIPTCAGPSLFAFNHPGGLGLVRRSLDKQSDDWRRLGRWLSTQ